jgi:hypothetical protein
MKNTTEAAATAIQFSFGMGFLPDGPGAEHLSRVAGGAKEFACCAAAQNAGKNDQKRSCARKRSMKGP